jgi:hypothetical protein
MIRESSIKLSIVVNSTARLDRDIRPKEVSALSSTTLRESQLPPLLEGLQNFSGLDADRAATEGHRTDSEDDFRACVRNRIRPACLRTCNRRTTAGV